MALKIYIRYVYLVLYFTSAVLLVVQKSSFFIINEKKRRQVVQVNALGEVKGQSLPSMGCPGPFPRDLLPSV